MARVVKKAFIITAFTTIFAVATEVVDCMEEEPNCKVCKLVENSKKTIPEGYMLMSMDDVRNNIEECRYAMKAWGIAALSDGKFDGAGYGNKLTEGNHLGCDYIGSMLVMMENGRAR